MLLTFALQHSRAGIQPNACTERGGGTKHQIHIHRLLETKVPPHLSCSVPSRSWCGGLCTDGVSTTLFPGESARAPASLVLFLRYGRYCNDGGTLTLKAYVELLLTAAGKQRNAKSKKAKATTSTAGAGAYKQSFQLWKGLSPEQRNRYNLLACQIKMKRRSSV